jgi:hypothetical protein
MTWFSAVEARDTAALNPDLPCVVYAIKPERMAQ